MGTLGYPGPPPPRPLFYNRDELKFIFNLMEERACNKSRAVDIIRHEQNDRQTDTHNALK